MLVGHATPFGEIEAGGADVTTGNLAVEGGAESSLEAAATGQGTY